MYSLHLLMGVDIQGQSKGHSSSVLMIRSRKQIPQLGGNGLKSSHDKAPQSSDGARPIMASTGSPSTMKGTSRERQSCTCISSLKYLVFVVLCVATSFYRPTSITSLPISVSMPPSTIVSFSSHNVAVDKLPPQSHALSSTFILNQTITANAKHQTNTNALDVLVLVKSKGSHASKRLALNVHNLYHLTQGGIRRIIFVIHSVDEQTSTLPSICEELFDILPNHHDSVANSTAITASVQLQHMCILPIWQMEANIYDPETMLEWASLQHLKLSTMIPYFSETYLVVRESTIFHQPIHFLQNVEEGEAERVAAIQDDGMAGWAMVMSRLAVDFTLKAVSEQLFTPEPQKKHQSILSQYTKHALRLAPSFHFHINGNGKYEHTSCNFKKSDYITVLDTHHGQSHTAPYFIWNTPDTCPPHRQERIGIWHDFHKPPWGGGNQFLLALRYGMENHWNRTVIAKNDPDGKQLINNSTDVMLANAITFKGKTTLLDDKLNASELALVHRIDGPYYVARYFRPLGVEQPNIPKEDRQTQSFNRKYACATIFQSKWSRDANIDIQLDLRNPFVAPNTINPTIFFPSDKKKSTAANEEKDASIPNQAQAKRIRIVASSHSNNARKGFDTMQWLDAHLDFTKYEFIYMGGVPAKGFKPQNFTRLMSGTSEDLAKFLRTGDMYLAPSRAEPASNAVMEALASGLPVVYQEGSSHGDLVGKAGEGFSQVGPDLLRAIDRVADKLEEYVASIYVPTIEEVSKLYLSVMRWCFHMKGLVF